MGLRMTGVPDSISLTPGKRVLFLTKDLDLIRKQLYEGLNLRMEDLRVEDLLDDINTDVMTPAWVCFDHEPAMIAKNAYAGLMQNGRFSAGFKHSGMMIIVALIAFNLLVFSPNLIGESSYAFSQLIVTGDSSYHIGLNPSGGVYAPSPII